MSHDPHSHSDNSVELPTPTAWPILTAFGLTLGFTGLVTDFVVSLIGLLCGVIGAIGWFTDVFPHPKHDPVPFEPHLKPKDICRVGREVSHLHPGEEGHRAHLPAAVHPYAAGITGGLLGAIAMAIVACAWGLIFKGSIWYPVNLLAASGMPGLADAPMKELLSFNLEALIVGLVIHITVSILVGLLYTVLLPMLPAKREWIWGGIVTPLIWTGLIWASLRFVNPALNSHIEWIAFIISQVAFGAVCGYSVYKSTKVETMQSWPISAKLGVEAQRPNKD
jgi:hypothetical protein